jgi:hypothetical protein
MGDPLRPPHLYHPFYCEENIYLLCRDLSGTGGEVSAGGDAGDDRGTEDGEVIIITNPARTCAMARQKAAPPGDMIIWDYHVILHRDGFIYDFDSRLGFRSPAREYIGLSFPPATPPALRPLFRLITARTWLKEFSSDRRHMRGPGGEWLKLPPPWPPLRGPGARGPHELARILDCGDETFGPLVDRDRLSKILGP